MIELTPAVATIVAAVIVVIGTLLGILLKHLLGTKGKKKGFEKLETELNLHKTTWKGEYWSPDGKKYEGSVRLKQFGSRVVGEATGDGRKWLIEGVASRRRLCYVYVDGDLNRLSLGTSILELDPGGKRLEGRWMGWSPDGDKFEPSRLVLTKQ